MWELFRLWTLSNCFRMEVKLMQSHHAYMNFHVHAYASASWKTFLPWFNITQGLQRLSGFVWFFVGFVFWFCLNRLLSRVFSNTTTVGKNVWKHQIKHRVDSKVYTMGNKSVKTQRAIDFLTWTYDTHTQQPNMCGASLAMHFSTSS